MAFIEAPSNFYLGRYYSPSIKDSKAHITDEVVYYESRDLTTHAVVLGMTGSGKTGLCVTLLEEAVLDQIPVIVIDPKGDITNLLLSFPDLQPQSFLPWINLSEAAQAGMSPEQYAQDVAQRWREGLESWGIGGQRVANFKDNAYFNIYTPGSDAGLPISILAAMTAPREGWAGHEEYHREHIRALTTAILTLIGYKPNPVKDREHVLIANIFEYAWRNGIDLSMQDIILQVQKPPFSKLGVFDMETFFPEKDRFKLAMELNNIIASPSFQSWLQGEPLDFQNLLYVQTPNGPKPRVNIFYVAHLSEEERSFIITLILESILMGMNSMRGTSSLRALVYFDEVFGHFPPHPRNPPTKDPLLRLLKQARAFGIGVVLATQNPGDLDYKGLSNAGTWFIGRLQTENDKKRVLDGLSSASTANNRLNVQTLDQLISSVDPRVFVMHNVHDARGPRLIHSRWAMSYLSGPLTREQIRHLTVMQQQLNTRLIQGYVQPAAFGMMQQPQYVPQGPYPQVQYPAPQQQIQQQAQFASPQFAPPPVAPNFAAPPAPVGATPSIPMGATPPPPSLPEAPGSYLKPSSVPPPPPSLPESTLGYSAQAASGYQYQMPNAPFQGHAADVYSPAAYQVPNAPYQGGSPTGYSPAQYQAPTAPLPGSATGYAPAAYQVPNAPHQGNAANYAPTAYQAPSAPFQGNAEAYAPAAYQVPNAPFSGGYTPPAAVASVPAWEVAGGAVASSVAQSPFGGTGEFTASEPAASRTGSVALGSASQPVDSIGTNARLPRGFTANPPPIPSSIEQYFLPVTVSLQQLIGMWEQQNRVRATQVDESLLAYTPFLLAQVQVRYLDQKTNVNTVETYAYHLYSLERAGLVHWDQNVARSVMTTNLSHEPLESDAIFGEPSAGLTDRTRITSLKKEVVDYISKTAGLTLPYNPTLKIYGMPGMAFRDYQAQVVTAAREKRDQEIDQVTAKFEREFDKLEARYRREERELRADQKEQKELQREELFTWGEAALSLLNGRTAYTLSRVSRARRYKGQAQEGVRESHEVMGDLEVEMNELQKRYEYELAQVNDKWNRIVNQVQEVRVTPFKKDIHAELFGIGWMPEFLVTINGRAERLRAWDIGNNGQARLSSGSQQGLAANYGGGGYSQASQPYNTAPNQGYQTSYNEPSYGQDDYQRGSDRRRNQGYDDGPYPNY